MVIVSPPPGPSFGSGTGAERVGRPTVGAPDSAHGGEAGGTATDHPRRLVIVHCLDNLGIGGTELNAVRTLERLDPARYDLKLLTLTRDGPLRERVERAGVELLAAPIHGLATPHTARTVVRLARQLREWGADVVHTHDCYTNLLGVAAARFARVPLVIASRRWADALPRRGYEALNRWAYRFSHRVLANSVAVGALLRERDHVPANRVEVVPNFLDDAAFVAVEAAERAAVRASWGASEEALIVGLVATLRPEKDVGALLEAAAMLAPRFPALRLVIVGEGTERTALERQAAALLPGRVHFTGYRPQQPNSHQFFDVSVLCSRHEGSPNSILEAMAAGRAIVSTRVGGVPDAITDGDSGVLVPPADPAALADGLARVLASPELRRSLGESARHAARNRYHAAAVLPRLTTLYESARTTGRVHRS